MRTESSLYPLSDFLGYALLAYILGYVPFSTRLLAPIFLQSQKPIHLGHFNLKVAS